MNQGPRHALLLTLLAAVLAIAFLASLLTGPAALPTAAALDALFGGGNPAATLVMQEIRLPRAILGLMIGATPAIEGDNGS